MFRAWLQRGDSITNSPFGMSWQRRVGVSHRKETYDKHLSPLATPRCHKNNSNATAAAAVCWRRKEEKKFRRRKRSRKHNL